LRILFDHQVFSWQTYGGVSRYFAEQMRGLKALGQEVFLPESFFAENVYLRELPDFQRKSLLPFAFKGKKLLQNLLGRRNSLEAIRRIQPDVFHPTYFDPYFLPLLQKMGTPFVLTVHDMIHEIYGHGSKSRLSLDAQVVENKRFLAEKADAVIAVSENTRVDLLRFCPDLDPNKIHVIHHGNSMRLGPASLPMIEYPNIPISQYLLFVGQRKAYKNFSWMLEHLAGLLQSKHDLRLVCVGGSAFDATEQQLISKLGLIEKVQYVTVGSDRELAQLYSKAACFIFPSQYEGFGIPVLEAFACGCPVILNRASSLPEVGADAALYFETARPETLETSIRQILDDRVFREDLLARGRARVQQFTWEQSVAKHLAVYQSLVK
jgi:glycosyltransferase involved in cell wall biosynthesis